jgi:hypothetical protein
VWRRLWLIVFLFFYGLPYNFEFIQTGEQQMSNKEQKSVKEQKKKPVLSLKEKRAAKKAKKKS